MSEWWIVPIFFVVWGLMYLFTRKDYDKNKSLSKKGFIKLIISCVVMFVIAFVLGILAGH